MSYSYYFISLPVTENLIRLNDLNLSELAQPLGTCAEIKEKISFLFNDIKWSAYNESTFGQLYRNDLTVEFTIVSNETVINAFIFSGPKNWIPRICKHMNLFCYDPQATEIWTPEGNCIKQKR